MSTQGKIWIGFILTLIIVVFIPVYWALEPGRQEAAFNRQQAEAAARGAELYTSNCAVCHGPQGQGNIAPALKGTSLGEAALAKIIARGVPGTAMPAWSNEEGGPLKEHQIKDLVTFIKNWDSAPEVEAQESESTPPATETPPAEINAGALFSSTCSPCHGVNRAGTSGFAPPLTPESLSKLSDAVIKETILNGRSGTAMPAFRGTLSPQEIDALLQFIKYAAP